MSAGWVAGTTRARALARRRVGPAACRRIAARRSTDEAIAALGSTAYRHGVREGQDLITAQHGVLSTLLWHVRILAGWIPGTGTAALRTLAGWFEIANVEATKSGGQFFELGALATAWPSLRSAVDLRAALTDSPWGDPGGSGPRAIGLGMRTSWALRVATVSAETRPWAAGAAALLAARETFGEARTFPEPLAGLFGTATRRAGDLTEFGDLLPPEAAWAIGDIDSPDDLWVAETRWWRRLERDGFALLGGTRHGLPTVLGAVAVLAADARRARASLELAARGGGPLEAFDALVA